ncbi:MAG: c-type cytochrome [Candidatus Solibacter usitatus]|nr:c-type cytochrome [Candidatus Solibacter usitatus]
MRRFSAFLISAGIAVAQDLANGQRIFQSQCAHCHGPRGEGGRGANLAKPRLRHAADDAALFKIIDQGIEGTEMPGAGMTIPETWQVVAFVKSLGRVPPSTLSGDPVRGEKIYAANGCAGCHTIRGRGGALGPDLTDVGARRSPRHLRASVTEPEAEAPDGFLQVRVTPRKGPRMTGVRVNEDTFSIQVRDLAGNLHSYWKNDLAELQKDRGKSPMPAYGGKLASGELDDLVAYLASLEGAR